MIEKDTIQELFSNALENHTASVRPELWAGVQAKMAVAGVSSVGVAKGISSTAKWLLGGAAAVGTAVITTVAVMNTGSEAPNEKSTFAKQEVITPKEEKNQSTVSDKSIDGTVSIVTQQKNELSERGSENRIDFIAPLSFEENERAEVAEALEAISITTTDKTQEGISNGNSKEQSALVESILNDNTTSTNISESEETKTSSAKITKFPNVFTPNGDRENDLFRIDSEGLTQFSVTILDNTNKTVFKSSDPQFVWDGTGLDGNLLPAGNYVCFVVAQDETGKAVTAHQYVAIRR